MAKNIEYNFNYDLDECLDVLKEFNFYDYFNVIRQKGWANLEFGQVQLRGISGSDAFENSTKFIDFILPIENAPASVQLILPNLFLNLNFIKDELHLKNSTLDRKKEYTISEKFPKLKLECRFLDMGLRSLSKTFEFNFTYDSFTQLINANNRFNTGKYEYDFIPIEIKKD